MITLSKHIEILLAGHECVVVPGFGGFITCYSEAERDEESADESTFYPPVRTVRFNQDLKADDGLLVHSYMLAYDAPYVAAARQMRLDVAAMLDELDVKGEYQMENIGRLRRDLKGQITLETDGSGITTPWLFGLPCMSVESLASLNRQRALQRAIGETSLLPVVAAADGGEVTDGRRGDRRTVVVRLPRRWVDVAVSAAAAVVLFFLLSYPAAQQMSEDDTVVAGSFVAKKASLAETSTTSSVKAVSPTEKDIEETAEETTPTVAPTPVASQPEAGRKQAAFTIVMACHVGRANAADFIRSLERKGFDGGRYVRTGSMSRILYSEYATAAEAEQALHALRLQAAEFKDAWVMEL